MPSNAPSKWKCSSCSVSSNNYPLVWDGSHCMKCGGYSTYYPCGVVPKARERGKLEPRRLRNDAGKRIKVIA